MIVKYFYKRGTENDRLYIAMTGVFRRYIYQIGLYSPLLLTHLHPPYEIVVLGSQ